MPPPRHNEIGTMSLMHHTCVA